MSFKGNLQHLRYMEQLSRETNMLICFNISRSMKFLDQAKTVPLNDITLAFPVTKGHYAKSWEKTHARPKIYSAQSNIGKRYN